MIRALFFDVDGVLTDGRIYLSEDGREFNCRQGVRDKRRVYLEICRLWRLRPDETAAIGDDEPDLPMIEEAGFSACPADAAPPARKAAKVVLKSRGGRGAAREFIERVLALNASRSRAQSKRAGRSGSARLRRGRAAGR